MSRVGGEIRLKLGTRGSALAQVQSNWVADQIRRNTPFEVETVIIKTTGDKMSQEPLSHIGGKGVFVKEIEEALFGRQIDIAVHSLKDVPAEVPPGLYFPVVPLREDPLDALIAREGKKLEELRAGARIGTGSLRRGTQLRHYLPHAEIVPIRGNLDTRIRKLGAEDLDAIIVAVAGMNRMGVAEKITQVIPEDVLIPAIGQGALGIEIRREDSELEKELMFLDHPQSRIAVSAERAFLRCFGGGCQLPIAAHARVRNSEVILIAMVSDLEGTRVLKGSDATDISEAEELGTRLAEDLLEKGGRDILQRIYGDSLSCGK